jgi:hypothetical protein
MDQWMKISSIFQQSYFLSSLSILPSLLDAF